MPFLARPLLVVTLLTSVLLAPVTQAAPATSTSALSRADVEAIVNQYIAQHGDKLLDSIRTFQQREQMANATAIIRAANPTLGPVNAPVTIIEFVDFECPYCSRVHPTILALRQKYGNKIHWVAKHMPLPFHAKALGAAYAAQAAAQQGKYWDFSDKLWEKQEFLGDPLYEDLAKQLKLNIKKFDTDRASPTVKTIVQADLKDADLVNAHGTPFFLINGNPISGAMPVESFSGIIDAILSGKPVPQQPQQ